MVTSAVYSTYGKAITTAESSVAKAKDNAALDSAKVALDKATVTFKNGIQDGKAVAITALNISDSAISVGVKSKRTIVVSYSAVSVLDKGDVLEPIVWSTSNSKIATVDAKGVVAGVGAGNCTITAITNANDCKAEVVVTVVQPITGLKTNPASLSLATEGTSSAAAIKLEITDKTGVASHDIVVTSFDENYVRVESAETDDLIFTIAAIGSPVANTNVVFTDNISGKTATLKVKIDKPADVVINGLKTTEFYLVKGKTTTLKASVGLADYPKLKPISSEVEWSSSNSEVATVDTKGKVAAIDAGTCTISAIPKIAATGTQPLEYSIEVVNAMITGVKADRTTVSIANDANSTLTLTPTLAKNQVLPDVTYHWDVTEATNKQNIKYVEVTGSGNEFTISPIQESLTNGAGTTKLTFKDKVSGKSVAVTVKIGKPADTVVNGLKTTYAALVVGKSTTLKATAGLANPANKSDKPISTAVVWESNNPSVATVDAKGKVVAVSEGTCKVTARPEAGTGSLEYNVTVVPEVKSFSLYDANDKAVTSIKLNAIVD